MYQQLTNVWDVVKDDYLAGLINSERCLQAALYRGLRMKMPENFRIFVEPRLPIHDNGAIIPDIIICSDSKIVAVVEIKYVPHSYPRFEDDLKKFNRLADFSSSDTFDIAIDPITGKFDNIRYHLNTDSIFVFAVVGDSEAQAVWRSEVISFLSPEIHTRFLLMFGRINPKEKNISFGIE